MVEPAELFLNVRPPISKLQLDSIIAKSQGRLSLEKLQEASSNVGVSVLPRGGIVNRITFLPSLPRHLSLEGLQIGISVADLLSRYPTLRATGSEALHRFGIEEYEGASTRSGHEIAVRVRDGQVVAFDITPAGLRAAEARVEHEKDARIQAHRRKHEQRLLALANTASTRRDDDTMLSNWAGDVDTSQRLVNFMLTTATPNDWHAIASTWNWDSGIEPLLWIIRRPECDKATALQAFWLAKPTYFALRSNGPVQVPGLSDPNIELFYFVTEIYLRWTQGLYVRSEIGYDPEGPLPAMILDRDGKLQDVPASMGARLSGLTVSTAEYLEGIPSFLWYPGEIVS